MIREICLYIEGGSRKKASRIEFRNAFRVFLGELRVVAKGKSIGLKPIPCGSRTATFDKFRAALRARSDRLSVLLVDAEGPLASASRWEHLKRRRDDRWENPGAKEKHCHLMVQTMEAWLIADREQLGEYYGQGFQDSALPATQKVEEVDKNALMTALQRATRATKKKKYDKTRDAPRILERIRPAEVRAKAPSCERLFATLTAEIDAA